LVGRAEELKGLERALRRAQSGRGSTVLVAGEAGIGKTRLASELATRARAGASTRQKLDHHPPGHMLTPRLRAASA
jgi:predicted ATPase